MGAGMTKLANLTRAGQLAAEPTSADEIARLLQKLVLGQLKRTHAELLK
jgi:hypothetical protein